MGAGLTRDLALLAGAALVLVAGALALRTQRSTGASPTNTTRTKRYTLASLTLLTGIALLAAPLLANLRPTASSFASTATGGANLIPWRSPNALLQHSVSGWGIYSAQDAQQAADDGLENVFLYGLPYAPETPMGQTLNKLRLGQVDGAIWQFLHAYECTKLLARGLSIADTAGYCPIDYGETLDDLLADLTQHLASAAKNPNIVGFWILDDWPWKLDPGGVRTVLQQITHLVHTIAPGKPTVCGMGAELGAGKRDLWHDAVAQNFSPSGCDAVGVYVYSESVTDPQTSPASFDWSMKTLLPKISASLRAQGWQPQRQPMIGIAQAWAGTRQDAPGYYEIAPRAIDLAAQAQSFCRAGAMGIVFYGWYTSALTNLQTPANNAAIDDGMREGIAQCQQIWSTNT